MSLEWVPLPKYPSAPRAADREPPGHTCSCLDRGAMYQIPRLLVEASLRRSQPPVSRRLCQEHWTVGRRVAMPSRRTSRPSRHGSRKSFRSDYRPELGFPGRQFGSTAFVGGGIVGVRIFVDRDRQATTDERLGPLESLDWAGHECSPEGLGRLPLEPRRVLLMDPRCLRVVRSRAREQTGSLTPRFLDGAGIRVFTSGASERHPVHCRSCTGASPSRSCQAPIRRAPENTSDARIVTHLDGLAWEGAADVDHPRLSAAGTRSVALQEAAPGDELKIGPYRRVPARWSCAREGLLGLV